MSYHSFLRKGSPDFFLPPFLPLLESFLFLPTAGHGIQFNDFSLELSHFALPNFDLEAKVP